MNRRKLFPEIEPFRTGRLPVSDLHTLFYEEAGNPQGRPAVFLHGGPGLGIVPPYRRFFDPEFYRVVLLDQRGAGRSTPHAELEGNTTAELVEDLEKLRAHLGLEPWVVMGGSWGSTLALVYAIAHPQAVRGIIMRGIFLGRQLEIDWLFKPGGASEIFPDGWEKFVAGIPSEDRDDPVAAYYKRMTSGAAEERLAAARAWSAWESSIVTLLPQEEAAGYEIDDHVALAMGRTESHYMVHRLFLESDNFILDNAGRIAHIPCRIVQGRYDIICPVRSAWDLHRALPESDLRIVPDGAHSPLEDGMVHELVLAGEEFKSLY